MRAHRARLHQRLQQDRATIQPATPTKKWEAFLLAIMESFDNRGFTIKELMELLSEKSELSQALPDELAGEDRAFSERVGRR